MMLFMLKLPEKWFTLNLSEIVVTCDHDDVLIPVTVTMAKRIGVDYKNLCNFVFESNPLITLKQAQQLRELCTDPKIVSETKYASDATEIMRIAKTGVRLELVSHSGSDEYSRAKRQRITQEFPELPEEQIILRVRRGQDNLKKEMSPNTFIFIDDSPYNIISSTAPINILLRQPWNVTDEAREMIHSANLPMVAWRDTVTEVVDLACEQIAHLLRCRELHLKQAQRP